jgi:hypothetical protein
VTPAIPYLPFFRALVRADRPLASLWAGVLLLRGLLPAAFAVTTGLLVAAVERGSDLTGPLAATGVVFLLMQVLAPIHQALGANLGDRTAAWLYDRLTAAAARPPGQAHLESAELAADLTAARDFDLGMTGPPLSISMDFIAGGLVELIGGLASAVVLAAYAWWAPLLLAGAWIATHRLLRESAVWKDRNTDEVRQAQRSADYTYRLAVDPPASKELRLFGLAPWTLDRFVARRTRLHELQYSATRLRERPLGLALLLVAAAGPQLFRPAAALARGVSAIGAGLAAILAGAVLTPLLLPWLPGRPFALKGALAGAATALAILAGAWSRLDLWSSAALCLAVPALASWCAMNFTGSSTFTSPSGVEKEMRRAIPFQGLALLLAAVAWIYGGFAGS